MASDARKRAVQKYDAANTRQIHLKLNTKTDADILSHLDSQKSKQGYIKQLIRDDMGCTGCWGYTPGDENNPCPESCPLNPKNKKK